MLYLQLLNPKQEWVLPETILLCSKNFLKNARKEERELVSGYIETMTKRVRATKSEPAWISLGMHSTRTLDVSANRGRVLRHLSVPIN